ncbi:DUF4136 domain-containing protein [Sphingomonas sp.]|uniref:DUF4136 domain-containing protein n=1 Tax=Sphingomonas sp. TaxID=28214 RepID=UPI001D4E351F|nr:DUF4136 domain-containing protein [Sphingomonas sp.]MBX9795839.1 DUF4136 domain-containing protein [Sphingomonas sp.]
MRALVLLGMVVLAGCATNAPVRVTRFHLNTPIERVGVAALPMPGAGSDSAGLETQFYARAIEQALATQGFATVAPGGTPGLLANFKINRTVRSLGVAQAPVSVGIGGGSFGRGFGGGGSVAFPVGRAREREAYVTELFVQLKRPTGEVVWEGRAQSQAEIGSKAANPADVAQKLANALFQGFPGQSGQTISVP